jgi:GT2 family glycosyltransferase
LLIRKSVLEEVGGMDPRTLTLADDIDLCWRIRLMGYEIVVDTKTIIYHRLSATLNSFARETKRYISERNTLRMLLKNYSARSLIRVLPVYFSLIFSEILFFVIMRKSRLAKADLRAIRWNLENLTDTLRERLKVQKMRKISDKEIRSLMNPYSFKLAYFRHYINNRDDKEWQSYFANA